MWYKIFIFYSEIYDEFKKLNKAAAPDQTLLFRRDRGRSYRTFAHGGSVRTQARRAPVRVQQPRPEVRDEIARAVRYSKGYSKVLEYKYRVKTVTLGTLKWYYIFSLTLYLE
jgi:hypothetical protein